MNGTSYTYGTKPHAVTAVGSTSYTYDANGNMTTRGGQGLTWDVENRPVTIGTETYVYDGDGNRIKKTVGGVTTLYINKYYEKNLSTSTVTTSYYLGDKLVATREGTTLRYVHQDSLTSSSVMSDSSGASIGSIKYFPFGATRSGSVSTDKKFTGQRLDGTGLYYYNARYYDPAIGRFISADDVNPNYKDPQDLNKYTYCRDNPVKFTDPTGHIVFNLAAAFGGMIAGGVVGGIKYLIQNKFKNIDNTKLRANVIGGAVTGAAAGFTCGASLLVSAAIGAAANAVGGGVTNALSGDPVLSTLERDLKYGAIGGALSYGISSLIPKSVTVDLWQGGKIIGGYSVLDMETPEIVGGALSGFGLTLLPKPNAVVQVKQGQGWTQDGSIYDAYGNWIGWADV